MTYCFQVKLRLSDHVQIETGESVLSLADDHEHVALHAQVKAGGIRQSRQLVLRGAGYGSEHAAMTAGNRWVSAVQRAFARVGIGADFGYSAPRGGGLSEAARRMLEQNAGRPVIDETYDLISFKCEHAPLYFSASGSATVGKPVARIKMFVAAASRHGRILSAQERLAFDLFSASFFESNSESRLMILMMAVETLISPEARPEHVRAHVNGLISSTRLSQLTQSEKDSIVGSLRWLLNESVSQAGRRLAATLGDRRYGEDLQPQKFFTVCYELRSRLVHGYVPRPDRQDVGLRASQLQRFVGDLICGPELLHLGD